jgi:hypothetical protein
LRKCLARKFRTPLLALEQSGGSALGSSRTFGLQRGNPCVLRAKDKGLSR